MDELVTNTLIVEPWQQHMRLDQLLKNQYNTSSRTYFQKLIEEGFVVVNGRAVKKSYKPEIDDEIEVQFILTKELEVLPEEISLDILYEDEHMLAINKPANMVVHPGYGNWTGTFVNALLFYCKSLEKQDTIRPGIVHRLDKETSGVLIAAKTYEMHKKLSLLFSSRQIQKRYLCVSLGCPKEITIQAPIGRHPVYRKQMTVLAVGGKEAITHLEVVKSSGALSVVSVNLETGRTHQIRVHMRHIGHPLLGDSLYGREGENQLYKAKRQMLHAESIAFIHPITQKEIVIRAPLPEDMQRICHSIIQK
ncbi:MAG: putative pseudouridine synthase Cpar [Chlamydiia bacterium]|nr:putative pseudouridine synthase Cpar [Chlamydiia bacterium]